MISFAILGKEISESVLVSLIFCFQTLIPSVFPMMVATSILCRSGVLENCLKNIRKDSILGIRKDDWSIIITSWLSGFIIGPKIFYSRYENDVTDYAALTSNAGLGFVVSYVGIYLWDSFIFGIYIYTVQILISYVIFKLLPCKKHEISDQKAKKIPFINCITDSVQSCSKTVLYMCGFTVFFTSLKTVILCFGEHGAVKEIIVSSLTDINTGTFLSIGFSSPVVCAFLTGFTIGFGGLCVFFQTASVCKINAGKFLLKKLILGALLGVFLTIYAALFNISPSAKTVSILNDNANVTNIIISTFCLFIWINYFKFWLKSKLISKKY